MSRNAIVKGIDPTDIAGVRTAITNNNGTLCSDVTNTEQMGDFPSDADGAQFETDLGGLGYSIFVWDVPPLMKQQKVSGFDT